MARRICDYCGEPTGKHVWQGTAVVDGKPVSFTLCREHFHRYPDVIRGIRA